MTADLFIFAHEGRQFELTQMMGEQNLRRRCKGAAIERAGLLLEERQIVLRVKRTDHGSRAISLAPQMIATSSTKPLKLRRMPLLRRRRLVCF